MSPLKTVIIYLMVTICPVTALAQKSAIPAKTKGFYMSAEISAGLLRESKRNYHNRNADEKFFPGGTLFFKIGKELSPKWRFESGLGVSNICRNVDYRGYGWCGTGVDPEIGFPLSRTINYYFAEMPFSMSYISSNKRFTPIFTFGLSPACLVMISENAVNTTSDGLISWNEKILPTSNRFNLSAQLGIGLQYKATSNIKLTVQPEMKFYLLEIENNPGYYIIARKPAFNGPVPFEGIASIKIGMLISLDSFQNIGL